MSEKPVILCPGQGAQHIGMGKAWFEASPAAAEVLRAADDILGDRLGARLTDICFNGPEDRISRTDVAQPALFAVGVASFKAAFPGAQPDGLAAAAGLSLGEYTALHLAGAMSFRDALELVPIRGRAMQDAAEMSQGGMVAIVGGEEAQVDALCAEAAGGEVLGPANYNAPGQIVISGTRSACDRAEQVAATKGIRCSRLVVAGAFHSALMAPAAETLAKALAKVEIRAPRCTVMSNATGGPHGADLKPGETVEASIRRRLAEQLTGPVRWAQNCQWLIAHHGSCPYHEVGPGRVLAGLMKRIDRNTKVQSHAEPPPPPSPGA